MAQTDLHEKLCGFYEFMLGTVPNRDEFIAALRHTLTEEDIRVIFLLPFTGEITYDRFVKKAAKINISPEELEKIIRRLVPEGFIATYIRTDKKDFAGRAYPSMEPLISVHSEGRVFARGEIISMTEMQVRKPEHDPMRNAAAHWMDAMIEGSGITMPNKTPYYRIIPKEPTLPKEPRRKIQVGEKIEDPRAVLPFDVVSQMSATSTSWPWPTATAVAPRSSSRMAATAPPRPACTSTSWQHCRLTLAVPARSTPKRPSRSSKCPPTAVWFIRSAIARGTSTAFATAVSTPVGS